MSSASGKRHPPYIYRRRRIAALLLVGVLALGIWGVSSLVGAIFNPTPQFNVVAGEPCAPGSVQVKAKTMNESSEANRFAPEETVYFGFELKNIGSVPCLFDAGSAVQFLTVTSGDETIWTSRQCDRSELTSAEVTLVPNEPLSSPPMSWQRVYSSDSGCGEGQAPVTAAGASYYLTVEVGGVLSENQQQFVLD